MRQLFGIFQQFWQREPYYKQAQKKYQHLIDQRNQQKGQAADKPRNRLQRLAEQQVP